MHTNLVRDIQRRQIREREVLFPPFCECRLWLFLRTGSALSFYPIGVWSVVYCQADMKQTCIYVSVGFLIPTPNSVYGSPVNCKSAAKRGKHNCSPSGITPQTTNTSSSPQGSGGIETACGDPECINRPWLP